MASMVKTVKGKVVSTKMEKSIVLLVEFYKLDKRFKKFVRKSKKIMAHDPESKAKEGDIVVVQEGRPLSRNKRHTLVQVVERREII